jgi:hypothetical protein
MSSIAAVCGSLMIGFWRAEDRIWCGFGPFDEDLL